MHFPAMCQQCHCAFVWLHDSVQGRRCVIGRVGVSQSCHSAGGADALVGWLNPLTFPCQLTRCNRRFKLIFHVKVHLSYNFISDRGAVELLQAEHCVYEIILQDETRFGITVGVEGHSVVALKCLHVLLCSSSWNKCSPSDHSFLILFTSSMFVYLSCVESFAIPKPLTGHLQKWTVQPTCFGSTGNGEVFCVRDGLEGSRTPDWAWEVSLQESKAGWWER